MIYVPGHSFSVTYLDDTISKDNRSRKSFLSLSPTPMYLYIQGMAYSDIGYLGCMISLIYYSSEVSGFAYQNGREEIFLGVLPTCNVFKGEAKIVCIDTLHN